MFPTRFFCNRMFAPRYWPKIGETVTFRPVWAMNSNRTIGFETGVVDH